MRNRNKIIYWIATLWLALGMASTGIVQLLQMKDEVNVITQLGYPVYLLTLLGVLKILGVIIILLPKLALLKEWAYAGFFFAMAGAIFSHVAVGNVPDIYPALLLLVLTVISWYFRSVSRKITQSITI